MSDIATACMELGDIATAEAAYRALGLHGRELTPRSFARMNLLEIAGRRGNRREVERQRRSLETEPLTPWLATAFALAAGKSHRLLGDSECARDWLNRPVALAQSHGYGQPLIEASELLEQLEGADAPRTHEVRPRRPSSRVAKEVSRALAVSEPSSL